MIIDELHDSGSIYRMLFDSAGDAIFVHNEKKILLVNKKACEMLGYTNDELISMKPSEVDAFEQRVNMPERIARLKKHQIISFETVHQRKDGTTVPVEVTAQLISWNGVPAVISVSRDATKRKRAENTLLTAALEWQNTFDSIKDVIFLLSPDYKILRCNKAAYSIFKKHSSGEILGKFCWEVIHGTPKQVPECPIVTMEKTKKRESAVLKSGERWLEITVDPILDEENNINGVVHVISDVTERCKGEEELKESLSLLDATIESTTDGILVVDNAGKIIYSNCKFAKMWGITEEVMASGEDERAIGHVLEQLKNPEQFLDKVKYLYSRPEEDSFDEIEFKDGKIFERYSQPQRIAGKPVGRVWSFRDVTMSRKAVESLVKSENQYKLLVETTNTGYVSLDLEGRVLDANSEYVRLTGNRDLKDILGRKVTEWTAEHEKKKNAEAVKKCVGDGYVRNFEIDYVSSSGKITPIELNATVVNFENDKRILTLCRDITGRRKGEEELRKYREHLEELVEERAAVLVESEKKYRELVESTNSIILKMDKIGKVTFFNEFALSFFGYKKEEIIGKNVIGTIVPGRDTSGTDLAEMIIEIGKHPEKFRNNLNENMRKDGERVWIAWTNNPVFDKDGKVSEILCVGNDITEKIYAEKELELYRERLEDLVKERTSQLDKANGELYAEITRRLRAQEELQKSFEELENFFNITMDLLCIASMDGYFLRLSSSWEKVLGYSQKELMQCKFLDFVHPDDVQDTLNEMVQLSNQKEVWNFVNRYRCKDGSYRWMEWRSHSDGNIIYAVARDITARRQVEEVLRESEKRFHKIIEQAPISMAIVAMDGAIEYINRKAVETFGYLHEDIPNMDRWWEQAYPDEKYRKESISSWKGRVEKAITGKHEIEGDEFRVTCKDGTVKTMFIYGVPILNKVFVLFDDITERKRVEVALREREEQYRFLTENVKDVLWSMDTKTMYFRYVSPSVEKLRGYTPAEIIVEPFAHALTVEAGAYLTNLVLSRVADFISGKEPPDKFYTNEVEQPCKDGSTVWTEVITGYYLNQETGHVEMRGVTRDITERRQSEEALQKSNDFNESLIQTMPFGFDIVDENGNLLFLSPALEKVFGKDAVGKLCWNLYKDNKKQCSDCPLKQQIQIGETKTIQTSGVLGGKTFEVTHTGMIYEGKKALLEVFNDITERMRLEERIRHSEKMEAIGQLAGGVAHDFNNQLMGIMGHAQILYKRLDDPGMKGDVENILKASRRASDLTKNLLAFSRKGKYLNIPVNIHNIIEEVVSILDHSIDKRIELKRVFKASPATVSGDPTQLQNALLNLALNARDALPNGGEIVFSTENVQMEDVFTEEERSRVAKGRYLKICVMDNGTGMDEETLKHVFEPFFTTKQPGKGTGMGLASVYGTVKNHNGSINVSSQVDKGTVFSMFFHLLEGVTDSVDDDNKQVNIKSESRILLVDDEEIVRNLISNILRSFGYKVVTCKDGAEAVELYRQSWKNIDLVILDMMMPRMNGRDAFYEMRTINKDIKALLISGFSIDGEAQSLLDSGMKGFLQKPFNIKELSDNIEEVLSGKK